MTEETPGTARGGGARPAAGGAGIGAPSAAPGGAEVRNGESANGVSQRGDGVAAASDEVSHGESASGEAMSGPAAGAVTGAAYGMLFLLGLVLGVVGGFEHSWYAGRVPVAAIAWLAALFAVPYAMGRLMGGKLAALVPAAGWLASSFVLATPQTAGDLAIAGDSAGFCYLYGGAVAVAVAVLATRSTGSSWLLKSYGRG